MMLSLLYHCLACGLGVAVALLACGLRDWWRGLPAFQGLRRRLPVALLCLTGFVAWDMLPIAWHLPLGVGVGVLCLTALFREAIRPGGPRRPPDTKAGRGAV